VVDTVTEGCEWVLAGEGVATRKFDGACAMVLGGVLWKRRELKDGQVVPDDFVQVDHDERTLKRFGWVRVDPVEPEDRWFRDAVRPHLVGSCGLPDGTYELVGPKVNGNPERFESHRLIRHGMTMVMTTVSAIPLHFEGLRAFMADVEHEGIVWWRDPCDPHCDKAKLKRRDFR
jgi:hypothetical protein